jgi:hypothetical protein
MCRSTHARESVDSASGPSAAGDSRGHASTPGAWRIFSPTHGRNAMRRLFLIFVILPIALYVLWLWLDP